MDVIEQNKLYIMLMREHSNLNVDSLIKAVNTPEFKNKTCFQAYSYINQTIFKSDENDFNSLLKDVKNTRQFIKTLNQMKNLHKNNLRSMNYFDYVELLINDLDKLKNVLTDKNKSEKEIASILEKVLSPIDMRIIFFPNYYKFNLEIGDRDNMLISLCSSDEKRGPPNWNNFNYMTTYALCLFDLFEIFESLVKANDSLVFGVVNTQNTVEHTFYVKNNTSYTLENRLYNFTRSLINQVSEYIIFLFRKNYYAVFQDYTYRNDYRKEAVSLEFDNQFLIKNLLHLSKFSTLRERLCTIVKDYKSVPLTFNYNSKFDDILIRKKIEKVEIDSDKTIFGSYIKRLFDNLSDAQCAEIVEATAV